MKCALLFVLACLSVCCVSSEKEELWGHVYGKELGRHNVIVPSTYFQVKTKTITFPPVGFQ